MTAVLAPGRDAVAASVAALPRARRRRAPKGASFGVARSAAQHGNVWWFDVAPGALRVGEYQASKWEDAELADIDARDNGVMSDDAEPEVPARGRVEDWSRWSMNRMIYRLASLDYGPLFAGGGRPVMLTLTLPKRWERIAPTPSVFQKLVKRFLARYQYAWGARLVGVWKREFQRRGAPHLHILMTIPAGRTKADGLRFEQWVGPVWAQVCLPDGYDARNDDQRTAYREHALLGTELEDVDLDAVDLDELERQYGLHERIGAHVAEYNLIDPRRIAAYFHKHGAFASKGYQNEVPEAWEEAGEGAGRYWGYWGLKDATVRTETDSDDDPDDDGPSGGGVRVPRGPSGTGSGGRSLDATATGGSDETTDYRTLRDRAEAPHNSRHCLASLIPTATAAHQ